MKAIAGLFMWIIGVSYLSLAPVDNEMVDVFPYADKLTHFIFYSVMTGLFINAFKSKANIFQIALCFTMSFGMYMEILQKLFNAGRHFDIFDILANIIGSLIGALVYLMIKKTRPYGGF